MCNRHSTVAEKAYAEKSCLFPNHACTGTCKILKRTTVAVSTKNSRSLYKCKVKNMLCAKATKMHVPRPPTLYIIELNRTTT